MSKGSMMPFGGKPRASEASRGAETAPPPSPRQQQPAPQRAPETAAPAIRTILGPGCVVEGKLVCAGPTQLDGKVSGELVADDFLIIDRNAAIHADLDVQEVVVRGAVTGNIKATRRVTLEETAQVEGDVAAPEVEMRIGAQMSGKIDVMQRARETQSALTKEPAYLPHEHQPTPAYRQQSYPPAGQQAAQPAAAVREPAPAFVAFDDVPERPGA